MTYVLSDIHGNLRLYREIMEQINLQPEDTIYVLGDVIDQHPDGITILEELMAMPNAKLLLGNHEDMMLSALTMRVDPDDYWSVQMRRDALTLWYHNGGRVTHDAMDQLDGTERREIFRFLRSLPNEYRVTVNGRTYLLVHGAPRELCPGGEDQHEFTVWERLTVDALMPEGVTVIFGHTPTLEYQPDNPLKIWYGNRMIGIDCGSGFPDGWPERGRLACLRLEDNEIGIRRKYHPDQGKLAVCDS